MFIDKVTIQIQAGNGGNGKLSFRHTKDHKGGPDGGDGGRGGDIVLRADHNTSSLYKYRTNKVWRAADGGAGGTNRRHGKSASSLELIIPPGTQVIENETVIADLTTHDARFVAAKGGEGGFGNTHFKSSTRQAPRLAEIGEPGETKELTLELKLIAEVGIIGLPNAGKSTLLGSISNARPEIADYAFTTLTPNLGVVTISDRSVLFADIPGLIEGAADGRGLGDDFLRHVERTRVLIHMIDATDAEILKNYEIIQKELKSYSTKLANKSQLVVLNKIDALDGKQLKQKIVELNKLGLKEKKNLFLISAASKQGIDELLRATLAMVNKQPKEKAPKAELPVIGPNRPDRSWTVEKQDNMFVVHGAELEKIALRTDMSQSDAVARLYTLLTNRGVLREIERQGGVDATIKIGKKKLTW